MITEEDLKIIKEFIDNYEKIVNKYSEYKTINESIRKNIIFQKYNDEATSKEISYKRTQLLDEIQNQTDEYRKIFLLEQMKTLEDDISKLEKYKQMKIEEKYIEIYSGNLAEYFETKPYEPKEKLKNYNHIEQKTVIYEPKDSLPEKEYYYNEETTITQVYSRIKFIYDYYKETDKPKWYFDSELEKNIKFFEKFKYPIIQYNKDNKEYIEHLPSTETSNENSLIQKTK